MNDRPSQKPAFCPFVYHDGVDLFLEFDGQVLKFTFTEGGLHKALQFIPNVRRQPGFLSGGQNVADQLLSRPRPPKSVTVSRRTTQLRAAKARHEKLSPGQQSLVRNLVRKLG